MKKNRFFLIIIVLLLFISTNVFAVDYKCGNESDVSAILKSKFENTALNAVCDSSISSTGTKIDSGKCLKTSAPSAGGVCSEFEFNHCMIYKADDSNNSTVLTTAKNYAAKYKNLGVMAALGRANGPEKFSYEYESGKYNYYYAIDVYTCKGDAITTEPAAPSSPTLNFASNCENELKDISTDEIEYLYSKYVNYGKTELCNVYSSSISTCEYDNEVGYYLCDTYHYTSNTTSYSGGGSSNNYQGGQLNDAFGSKGCPLGPHVTKDLKNVLLIIRIAGPILMILLTVYDGIKAVSKGEVQAEAKKLFVRFKNRGIYVLILLFAPLLVDIILTSFGILDDTHCDLDLTCSSYKKEATCSGVNGCKWTGSKCIDETYACYIAMGNYYWWSSTEYNNNLGMNPQIVSSYNKSQCVKPETTTADASVPRYCYKDRNGTYHWWTSNQANANYSSYPSNQSDYTTEESCLANNSITTTTQITTTENTSQSGGGSSHSF